MQIIDKSYPGMLPLYPIEEFCPIEKALFFDIETTGLSKESTNLYLIGCGYYYEDGFMTRLFFGDSPNEEMRLIESFRDFLGGFTHIFHFNGNKFDVPYLNYKTQHAGTKSLFDDMTSVDVYQLAKPLRYLLFPSSMRQKSIEDFLGIVREDMYNGGELIEVYHNYVKTQSDECLKKLITHNREDVLGMHMIMPILHYLKLRNAPLTFIDYEVNTYTDYFGAKQKELFLTYKSPINIPKSFYAKTNSMYLKASCENNTFLFRLPIISGEMNHYFENYRDYVYLPENDVCIHKSVAMGLDKHQYVKATKETCRQKITGEFVKQPGNLFAPVLHTSLKDKASYFIFPDSFDTTKAGLFGESLLNVFFTIKKAPLQ